MASFLELQRVAGILSAFVDAFMRPFGGPRLASSILHVVVLGESLDLM